MNPILNTADTPLTFLAESGTNAVVAGTDAGGWISGDIASLAASATVTAVFDLGAFWQKYNMVQVMVTPVGPSTGLSAVQITSADTAAFNVNRRLKDALSAGPSTINASFTVATGTQSVYVKPAGRYLAVRATNADGAQALGATSKITVAAYIA
jgi:hypothetical protein